jgi:hypothetical protein
LSRAKSEVNTADGVLMDRYAPMIGTLFGKHGKLGKMKQPVCVNESGAGDGNRTHRCTRLSD